MVVFTNNIIESSKHGQKPTQDMSLMERSQDEGAIPGFIEPELKGELQGMKV
jgi:hypothetical protein